MSDANAYDVVDAPGGVQVSGGGVVIDTRHSRTFIRDLGRMRPGLDLVDELLRSEHSPYLASRLRVALEPFPERGTWRVLDFGCGPGASSVVLSRLGLKRIVGLDLVNDYAGLWRRRLDENGFGAQATFVQAGTGMRFPFRAGSFDLVLLNGVLEHMLPEERSTLLRAILQLVRPGGRILVAETPNRWFPRNSHTKLWFSEWLPFGVAAALAHRYRIRDDFPRGGRTALYRTGMRGMSAGQLRSIVGALGAIEPTPDAMAELEFTQPRNPLQNPARRSRMGERLLRFARGLSRATGIPLAYLAPHLNVWIRRTAVGLLLAALSAPASAAPLPVPGDSVLTLREIGRHAPGVFDQGGAEIAAFDPGSRRLFVVNGGDGRPTIDVLDLADPASPRLLVQIPVDSLYGGGANSVAARGGVIAVAVENGANKQAAGRVVFLDAAGSLLGQVPVGPLPDMLTFTPDGSAVLVCNEGEPDPSYANDPEGSLSVIDLAQGIAAAKVTTIGFSDFDAGGPRHAEVPAGVRVFGPGSSVAQDLEPEYVAVAPDGRRAWVSLQENNALAILDLPSRRVEALVALGLKDHRQAGQGLDPSDRDGTNGIARWPVFGMYQPDALAAFDAADGTYLVLANEGDGREYAALDEEARVADLVLDPAAFPGAAALQRSEALGRLHVTNRSGDVDGDGDFDELHAFGGRSVSIRDSSGALVWDSGELLERLTASANPERFNASDTTNDRDDRSDDKGPQPEGVAVGEVGGRLWAFIGLERMGGIVVLELSDPRAPRFHSYVNPRDFSQVPGLGAGGDQGPEGVLFINAADSPTKRPLLVVCNEVSGTTTIFAPEFGRR